ncbi:MAG: lactate racemase domain-containing protein, partial [Planctomycetales bacterium]
MSLHYGVDSCWETEFSPERLIADYSAPKGTSPNGTAPDDPTDALRKALKEPLNFPPVGLAVTPDDHVVIAAAPGIPALEELMAAVAEMLAEAGVDLDRVTLLQSPEDSAEVAKGPQPVMHDATDDDHLAYLASTKSGQRVYLNRLITDADLVAPIACLDKNEPLGWMGPHAALYPTFSNVETQKRFRAAATGIADATELRTETDEIGWLLGVQFSILVVPGSGGRPLDVIVGESAAAFEHAKDRFESAWTHAMPEKASLVIASVEGPDQSWSQVGRAAATAAEVV